MTDPVAQESYIVNEGKKRGSTRDVRPEALYDRFYTVLRVHPGDAILTKNWHTSEVFDHARTNFEGYTFAMLLFFVACLVISLIGQVLERRFGSAARAPRR